MSDGVNIHTIKSVQNSNKKLTIETKKYLIVDEYEKRYDIQMDYIQIFNNGDEKAVIKSSNQLLKEFQCKNTFYQCLFNDKDNSVINLSYNLR